MATGERYLAMASHHHHHFMSSPILQEHVFEDFEESDIWNTAVALSSSPADGEFDEPVPRGKKKNAKAAATATSLPMNVPDWSKILRGDYIENRHDFEFDDDDEEDDDEDEGGVRFAPHEFLARQRRQGTASFSVHEGIGKGRDLSRLRNAIWKQTGFED